MSAPKKMSLAQLTLMTSVTMMGSGIIMLPTKLAQVGTISVLSWLVTAVGSICLAYIFAKCAMFTPKEGLPAYSEHTFGKAGYFLVSYCYAISAVIAVVAILTTSVSYAITCFGWQLNTIETCMVTIGLLWFCCVGNFLGDRWSGRLSSYAVWCVIAPIMFLSVAGWFWFDWDMYVGAWNPHDTPLFDAVSASISMTLWAFLGLETACTNANAIENPQKNVPLAVMFATVGVAIIYILSTNIIAGIVPNLELANSNAPLGLVFTHMFSPEVGRVIGRLLVISCTGCAFGWQFTISQLFQLSSKERLYPRIFNKVNRFGSPAIGLVIITIIQTGICLLTASPSTFEQFTLLSDLSVVTILVPYIISMASIRTLMDTAHVSSTERVVNSFIAFLAIVYSFYAIYAIGETVVFYTAMVIFFGWVIWGFIAPNHDLPAPKMD